MLTEYDLQAADLTLHVAQGPKNGPPLVLLHGVGRRWQDFVPIVPALSLRWQVMALDFRGHGRSGRTPGRYHVADYVQDAIAVLQQIPQPVILYGHSLGALVAGATAAARPESVRAVILEDPPGGGFLERLPQTPSFAMFQAMQQLAGQQRSISALARELAEVRMPAFPGPGEVLLGQLRDAVSLRFSARCLVDLDPDVYAPILARRWLDGFNAETIWRAIRCPTLLLRGDESYGGMLPRADADVIAHLVPDCTSIDVPGVGHLIHWSAAETTLRLVHGFLESL